MSWQDIVLSVGSAMFMIALIPSILSDDKPAVTTSLMTGTVLIVFAATYASLGLWFTTVITALTAAFWLILFAQKLLAKRRAA
ncbi:MAG: hypothetical protein WD603_01875 [Patescibacteria group bacterium]